MLSLQELSPRVSGLCWGEWGIVGKSGGLWWNGAGRGGRGVAGVEGKSSDGNSATFELGGKTGVNIWHVYTIGPCG
nr:hypothetical protein [Tanacetum cinerariifolium]